PGTPRVALGAAGSVVLRVDDAAALEPQALAALAPRRDLHLHAPRRRRRDVDRRPEHRLAHGHRHLDGEVGPLALDERVGTDLHAEVEVPGRPVEADAALAPHADARAVADAGRNLHLERLALLDAPRPGAACACPHALASGAVARRTGHRTAHADRGLYAA